MPLISVIIPTYNRGYILKRAIDSVLNQTFKDLECIVVDDGSNDETQSILKEIKDKRLKVIKSENRGVSAARNLGHFHSSGEWIALLDSDDEWLLDKLEKQLALLGREPDLLLIHGEEIWIRKGKRVNPKFKHKKEGGRIFERCLELCLISPSAALIKRELYEEMKGFREDFVVCEDYELWLRVTQKYEVGYVEDPILKKYGGHDDQLSTKYKAMDFWRVKAMEELYRNPLFNLKEEERTALVKVLLEKCHILQIGYEKHQNLEHLPYIKSLISEFSSLKES
jgi:glycosyltransferase involved in cell wall biosynthesis